MDTTLNIPTVISPLEPSDEDPGTPTPTGSLKPRPGGSGGAAAVLWPPWPTFSFPRMPLVTAAAMHLVALSVPMGAN
jgi:hypothetical protein